MLDTSTLLDMKRASHLSRCVDTGVEFVEVVSVDTGVEVSSGVGQCRAVSGGTVGVSSQGSTSADAGCTGATGTRGYGGCAGAAVLGCGRGVPLKTVVESSPWTERGAPKSALTHQKQTPFFSSSGKSKSTNAPWQH